jgi:hypothetical protein
MILSSKPLSDITEADLKTLVDSGVQEGKTIDYKRELPGNADAEKKEFLFDVSSFANASGGFLLYGIDEQGGIPTAVPGVTAADLDAEIRRLQSLILDSIDPRIQGLELRFVPMEDSTSILVIHIPKSWVLPHMVTFRGTDKFYSRNSGGKHRLDMGELRSLFALGGNISAQVRKFREERMARIISDETPIPLGSAPKIILHIIPLHSLSSPIRIDLRAVQTLPSGLLYPFACSGYNDRVNLDGILHYSPGRPCNPASYLQLFENGIIETVNAEQLSPMTFNDAPTTQHKMIPSLSFEEALLRQIPRYLQALQKLGTSAPILVTLVLTGVKDFHMAGGGRSKIDRDILIVPELVLEKFEASPLELRPLLDSVWHASGVLSSPNFDPEGNWEPNQARRSYS